jgi:hypothetical protein
MEMLIKVVIFRGFLHVLRITVVCCGDDLYVTLKLEYNSIEKHRETYHAYY